MQLDRNEWLARGALVSRVNSNRRQKPEPAFDRFYLGVGRGSGVGRVLGVGVILGVAVAVAAGVAVAVGVGVGVGVGPDCVQYLAPVFKGPPLYPPQIIISPPVQTAV